MFCQQCPLMVKFRKRIFRDKQMHLWILAKKENKQFVSGESNGKFEVPLDECSEGAFCLMFNIKAKNDI